MEEVMKLRCPKCNNIMISKTDVNKAFCALQYMIDNFFFCFDCNVKQEMKATIKEVLENPAGESCGDCKRRGSAACIHERFGDLEFGSDNCFTPGERQLSVRMDCSIKGDAYPCQA